MKTLDELIESIKRYGDCRAASSWWECVDNLSNQDIADGKASAELSIIEQELFTVVTLAEERAKALRSYRDRLLRVQGEDPMDRWVASGGLQCSHSHRIDGKYDAVLTAEGVLEIERLNNRLGESGDPAQEVKPVLEFSTAPK